MVEHTGHTPTPWVVDPNFPDDIQDSLGNEIATLFNSDDVGELLEVTGSIPHSAETSGANARFVVHAVNCHADLLAALERAVSWIEDLPRKNASHQLNDEELAAMRNTILRARAQ